MPPSKLKSALSRYQNETALAKAKERKQTHSENIRLAHKKAEAAKTRAAQSRNPKKVWHPFNDEKSTILLVGEGDFSFALAFSQKFGHERVIATSYDSLETINTKYPHANADIFPKLEDNGVEILHDIDVTKLSKYKFMKTIDHPLTIVFNFPHLGNSVSDQDRNIRQHQELINNFFNQCRDVRADNVVLTVFCGEPYDSWQFKAFAKTAGYKIDRSGQFNWSEWPEYRHQLTSKVGETHKTQTHREARMYHWVLNAEETSEEKKKKERQSGKRNN